jgi:3-oxoacyl-[acyl-carrier protein] reductase
MFRLPGELEGGGKVMEDTGRETQDSAREHGLLAGQVAVVTGGAGGIGRGIVRQLHREGAQVAIADLNETDGLALEAELGGTEGGARFLLTDLSEAGAADALIDAALAVFARLDMLVHSASPQRLESDTIFGLADETWQRMLTVNVTAGFRLARRAAREMLARDLKGRMLFITSLHAETPRNLAHYSASKGALQMVMRDFARTLAPHGIRVNAIAPGAIMSGGMTPAADLASKIPLGRLGEPADIASMALVLLVDRFSAYVTGATVVVDGGLALYNWIPWPEAIEPAP